MINRRTIFALLGLAALPVAAKQAEAALNPAPPKPPRGMLLPRVVYQMRSGYVSFAGGHSHEFCEPVALTEYDIFDGEKWVPFNSVEGHKIELELRGCG